MKVQLHNIPRSLKTLEGNRFGLNNGKIPCKVDGSNAKSNDPDTWACWKSAEQAYLNKQKYGFGLSVFLGGELVCLDFDKVRDPETGEITNETAREILDEIEGIGYAEVSRSGTGVHVFMIIDDWSRADRYRSEVDLGGGAQLEIFFEKRHICLTGNTEGFDDWDLGHVCQTAFDWVCENYALKEETVKRREGTARVTDGLSRILKGYCNEILLNHRQNEGGRDNWLFRAGSGVADRCGRDCEVVRHWVHEFNRVCCVPPLPPEDCDRIAESCCQNSERRYIEPKEYRNSVPVLNTNEMSEKALQKWSEDMIYNLTKTFDLSKIRNGSGFIPEFMRHCEASGDRPTPELDFAAALATFGTIIADKCRLEDQHGGSRPNVTVIATADSGVGKDFGRKLGIDLIQKIGLEDRVHGAKVSSGQGIYTILATQDPCTLFPLDEFADALGDNSGSINPIAQGIGEAVKLAYSADGGTLKPNGYRDEKLNQTIRGCAPSFYITSTTEAFWNSFRATSASDGFLGRVMYFDCPTRRKKSKEERKKLGAAYVRPKASEKLIQMAKAWIDINPVLSGIDGRLTDGASANDLVPQWKMSKEAFDLYIDLDDEIDSKGCSDPSPATPLWRRCNQNILKTSLILAASRTGPNGGLIEAEDMQLAIAVVKAQVYAVAKKLIEDLVDSNTLKLGNRIAKRLEKFGKPATVGYFKRWGIRASEREINEALRTMVAEETIFDLGDGRFVAKACYDPERDGGEL